MTTLDRDKIIKNTEKEDERSDLKQHADKMLRDFERFNDSSATRAIWELVQNACDLTEECEIIIDYRNKKIAFTHNGKPFKTKSLISLIKQVSGKYGEEEIKEVGKYGTGFLVTHCFGRKFTIDSILEVDEYYFPVDNFEIDRSPQKWEELSDNISIQKRKVYEIIKTHSPISVNNYKTTFTYLPETQNEIQSVEKSQQELNSYIPLVLTVNKRIKKIEIIYSEEEKVVYEFVDKKQFPNNAGINLYKTEVATNGEKGILYSLRDEEEEIEIILPINENNEVYELNEKVARLFLYYPLIGSESFGINFIINCNRFLPTEPRNGIHLSSNKDQIKDQEESNRNIISRCNELIFSFLKSDVFVVKDSLHYTNINFNTESENSLQNEYFSELQKTWNDVIQSLRLVETSEGYKTVGEATYFSKDFISEDNSLTDLFYELSSKFYPNLPPRISIKKWSENAQKWKNENISFIGHQELVEKISNCSLSDFQLSSILKYYRFLIDNNLESYFTTHSLLPNIVGEFKKMNHFIDSKNLNDKMINIGKVLIPEKISQLIHKEFIFDFTFNPFTPRNFSDEIKNCLENRDFSKSIFVNNSIIEDNYDSELFNSADKLDSQFFYALLDVCKLNTGLESTSKPINLVREISKYYGLNEDLILIPQSSENDEKIEIRTIRKSLVKIFFNLIALHNAEWVADNTNLLLIIHSLYDDSYKDIYKESRIYPNQVYELHFSENLKRDDNVKDDIKELYFEVKKEDINEKLSLRDFNKFILEENIVNNKYLTTIIEDEIFSKEVINIEEHENIVTILKIIPKLSDKLYQQLFPHLNERKASIMISVVTNEEKKEDIFAIVMLESDKLKSIGKLIANPNFEDILFKASELLVDEHQQKANFQFKHKIGTHIEKVLREHLQSAYDPNDIIYEVKEEQDGQDIIIKIKNDIKYYIEVKSRWDKKSSVRMSKNQTLTAYENQERYALCSVDMTDYFEDDRYEVKNINNIVYAIRFITTIGNGVEHLISVLKQTNEKEQIHLDGDYRTLIPQEIIEESGIGLNEFESYLVEKLKTHAITN